MDQKEISFIFRIHHDQKNLTVQDRYLMAEARKATSLAYAPYSKFKVGVAIRTKDNDIVIGSNQENSSFPIGQCAERVALYNLSHEYGRKRIDTIAIVADHQQQKTPATPCGSCRQLLVEYRNNQEEPIRLILGTAGDEMIYEIDDVIYLLPLSFEGSFLGQ